VVKKTRGRKSRDTVPLRRERERSGRKEGDEIIRKTEREEEKERDETIRKINLVSAIYIMVRALHRSIAHPTFL
jgi:hypothetical protein